MRMLPRKRVNMKQYLSPADISDADILREYLAAKEVKFSAKNFNHIRYRKISFGKLGWWLPLSRVLPVIGITPTMLRPVFNPQTIVVKKAFPLWNNWFKIFCCSGFEAMTVELPEEIDNYDQLGSIQICEESFYELAKVLDRKIVVLREDGGNGAHSHIFSVDQFGRVE